MPFKSEKQRRFLWAEHPEIAKRWAHEYPESNKDLPMYAHKNDKKQDESKSDEKAAQINVSAVIRKIADNWSITTPSILGSETTQNSKKADSKQEKIDIPHSEKPTYAGEEREKGISSEDIPLEKNLDGNCGGNAINSLLQKLSVVLSPSIQQTMENMNAENEGRVPRRIGRNGNLKHYPVSTPQIPLPMGMQQQQAQTQSSQQPQSARPASITPVGAGQSSATTDPIKFHSGLSASGIINGNAALSAPNTVNTKISAENTVPIEVNVPQVKFESKNSPLWLRSLLGAGTFGGMGLRGGALLGGLAGTAHGALTQPGEYVDAEGKKQKQTRLQKVLHDALAGVGIGGLSGGALGAVGGAALPFTASGKTSAAGNSVLGQLTSIHGPSEHDIADLLDEEAYERMKKANKSVPCSCGCGDTSTTCKCPASCSCRKPGGSCYKAEKEATLGLWDRIRAKRERGGKPAKPGDKDYPDAKSWKKVTAISEKQSGTPAWQRSAGKNEEGGLNAKGRASYNRETGGHLKAPVTEKNPTGERNKRQNSFCSRMCGMKKHETGSKTKSDPDSRINKALRKWNCKCGSEQKTANWFEDAWPNTSAAVMDAAPRLSYKTTPLHTIMGTLAGAGYGGLTGRNVVRNALRGGLIGTGAGLGNVYGQALGYGLNNDINGPHDDVLTANSYVLGGTAGTLGGALGGNQLYNVLEGMYDKRHDKKKKKQQEKTSSTAAAFGFKVAQDMVKDFDPALSRDAENAIMHGTGLVGSGALGTVAGIPVSAGLEHLVRQNNLMPDSDKSPWSHFFTQALIRTPIVAGGMLGTRLYDNYILRPHMRREMERKKQEDEIRQQLAMKKQAEASLGRVLGTALASTGGGLLLGGYPGWKLQRASEAAGNNDFMNFIAGKAPIALAGALSGAAFNHMYDRYEKKHPPKQKTPANPSLQYLQYLVH